jgi:glyoxylase-like metal-dependent hydrolase (beta-lactamase superfamily II)
MPSNTTHFLLEPAQFRLDGGAMFGIIPKPLWSKVAPADSQNRIQLALRLWLIKTNKQIILVDTGIGDYHPEKFNQMFDVKTNQNPLKESLNSLGLSPNDVTDLVLSHFHFDHIGGIATIENGNVLPVLPNAKIYYHEEHYQHALNPTQRDAGSFQKKYFEPVMDYYRQKNLLIPINGEDGKILDYEGGTLNFTCSHGHTPFLMHPFNDKYIYLTDILPTSNHIKIPWVMGYDLRPAQSTIDKKRILELTYHKKLIAIFEHDPDFWGASVERCSKKGFIPKEKFPVQELNGYQI